MNSKGPKPHPLDPLSSDEINGIRHLVNNNRGGFTNGKVIFNSMCLMEPEKEILLPILDRLAGGESDDRVDVPPLERRALVILIERPKGTVWEVVVNTTKMEIESFKAAEHGLQPTITLEETIEAEEAVIKDPRVQERYFGLGYKDLSLLVADPWSIGYYPEEKDFEGRRLSQVYMFAREFPEDNHYAHPLDFAVVVDLNEMKVIRIDDVPTGQGYQTGGKVPVPKRCWNYDADILGKEQLRKNIKPIEIRQPEGTSFKCQGNMIKWQNFQFRHSFNYREGLVLHDVRYKDGDRIRPLFYRLSISEMLVPYGDPRPPYDRKTAFDVGDYGLGLCTNSLELGCDCVGEIKYFDGIHCDHSGNVTVIKNAICLHEEDNGILWKHTEYRTGKVMSARARKLVISFIATFANYEYGFYWYFTQDGSISLEVKATGQLSTVLIDSSLTTSPFGTVVAPSLLAQNHQHIYCIRVDPMIDGLCNSVSIVDVGPMAAKPGSPQNPHGQGFSAKKSPIRTIKDSTSDVCSESQRSWLISNNAVLNPINQQPVAWKLAPWGSGSAYGGMLAQQGSIIRKRAAFCTKSLWVTKYSTSHDLYASGFYVNQCSQDLGLSKWTDPVANSDTNLWEEDVVLWHVFGVTHLPRVEDHPIMNVESCGFTLKPCNFFTSNPAIDVPASNKQSTKSKLASCCSNSSSSGSSSSSSLIINS